jgi:HAD superfamily hydrolase (TIGR01509 family)
MLQGVIFDMDGTLIDSQLDFEAMRIEMGLTPELRILESIARLPPDRAAECHQILHRHELEGARQATLLPGARQVVETLHRWGVRTAIATRNSRIVSNQMLKALNLHFEIVLTRDDGPIKPDPWPVLHACQQWGIPPQHAVMIGDYHFDVDSGRAAGAHTVILTHQVNPSDYPNEEQADLVLRSLAETDRLLAWLQTL